MTNWCDLHAHTTVSDGRLSPREMVAWAGRLGLAALGITDHDTMAGLPEAEAAGGEMGVEVVPGVEISTEVAGRDVHVLGYYVQRHGGPLVDLMAAQRQARLRRAEKMVQKAREAGYAIDLGRVLELGAQSVGRPHIAQALVEQGYAANIKDAFDRFLGRGRAFYVAREKLGPEAAVRTILAAGGVPVIAHPGLIGDDAWVTRMIRAGALGMEVYYVEHTPEQTARYERWAAEAGLVATGGSDCHAIPGRRDLGSVTVDYSAVERLRALARR